MVIVEYEGKKHIIEDRVGELYVIVGKDGILYLKYGWDVSVPLGTAEKFKIEYRGTINEIFCTHEAVDVFVKCSNITKALAIAGTHVKGKVRNSEKETPYFAHKDGLPVVKPKEYEPLTEDVQILKIFGDITSLITTVSCRGYCSSVKVKSTGFTEVSVRGELFVDGIIFDLVSQNDAILCEDENCEWVKYINEEIVLN